MKIEPLQPSALAEARRVAAELFPWENEHQTALEAALFPEAQAGFLCARRLERTRFWTATFDGRVVGLAGLYEYCGMPSETWLSWYGLLPVVRGRGHGARLLDWIIRFTREEGRAVLRLWTTVEDEYQQAIRLYERRGFTAEEYPALPGETWRTLVMSLGHNGVTPIPWLSIAGRPELAGRMPPPAVARVA
ncbi:MAG: GNAT family N-acetyltransferase [Opitutaceae bacterium]|nr:GNAT family N-acetyltransferase [Opitutaceae bacterium]